MKPRKAAEKLVSVVPVFVEIGPLQPVARAALAAVPVDTSLPMPLARAWATLLSRTCSQGFFFSSCGMPLRSVTDSTGVGSHQRPLSASVVATLDSSRGLTGVGPSTKEPRFAFFT